MQATKDQLKNIKILKNRADFLIMNKDGVKWVSQGLILLAMPNDLDVIRVGFTVTKKTDPSAVKRNRIKRRLRAVAADVLPQHARGSCDYVLIGRALSASRPYEALATDLRWCLKKLGYGQ